VEEIRSFQKMVDDVRVPQECIKYATQWIRASRSQESPVVKEKIVRGADTDAGFLLLKAAKGLSALQGEDCVSKDCIQQMALYILLPRLTLHKQFSWRKNPTMPWKDTQAMYDTISGL
jgi:MoxR-like ATPase